MPTDHILLLPVFSHVGFAKTEHFETTKCNSMLELKEKRPCLVRRTINSRRTLAALVDSFLFLLTACKKVWCICYYFFSTFCSLGFIRKKKAGEEKKTHVQ